MQGLGPDLLGRAVHSGVGASALTIRRDDGALMVGEIAAPGDQVDLHEITLSGSTVATDHRVRVGTAGRSGSGGIAELASLPNGDVLIAVQDLQVGPPLHGAMLAIVARSGAVTPVPTQVLQAEYPLALAVDPAGTTAYLVVGPIEPHAVHLYAIPLPAGGTARLVGTFGPVLTGLAFDPTGDLIACSTTELFVVDTVRGTLSTRANLRPNTVSLASEAATGGFAVVQNGFGGPPSAVHHLDPSGASTPLTSAITGVLSDVAVLDNPRAYGPGTAGNTSYGWQVAPAPGGLPRVGNSRFALQVIGQGGPLAIGVVVVSPASGSLRLLGVEVLLDPSRMFTLGRTTSHGALTMPIPIGAPVGAEVFLQSFHLDAGAAGGIAATPGQRVRLMR